MQIRATDEDFYHWYTQGDGKRVFEQETLLIKPLIKHFKPYRTLFIGDVVFEGLPESTVVVGVSDKYLAKNKVVVNPTQLPFQKAYFDLIICPHWHEVSESPLALFSELSRVLIPQGLLVCYSMNPHGLYRLEKQLSRADTLNWQQQQYTPNQIEAIAQRWDLERAYHFYAVHYQPWQSKYYEFPGIRSTQLVGMIHETVLKKSLPGTMTANVSQAQWAGSF